MRLDVKPSKQIGEKFVVIDGHEHAVRVFAPMRRRKSMWSPPSGKRTEKGIVLGFIADRRAIDELRERCPRPSWSEIATVVPTIECTPAEADWLHENGFGRWVHRHQCMVISTRFVRRLSDLSARVGFDAKGNTANTVWVRRSDGVVAEKRSELCVMAEKFDWIGPFIRTQFLKAERRKGGRIDVRNVYDARRDR